MNNFKKVNVMKRLWILIIAIGGLVACASEPMMTDVDVLVHQNQGELLSFYERLQSELKLAKPKSDLAENRQIYIAKVGEKIAEEKEQVILNELDRELSKHSIAILQSALEKSADMKPYSEKSYTDLRMQFEQAISQKKGVILSKEAQYYELTDKDALLKVQLLEEIATIYGPGQDADQIAMQRTAYVNGLFQNAQTAMTNKRNEDVVQLLASIEKIDPNYPGLGEMRHQLLASDYEQQFWDALGKGQTDKAYETFHKLTQIPDYVQTHPDVVPIAEDMAQFFIAEGDQAMKEKLVETAYLSYSRSRYIHNVIGKAETYSPGEKKFIEFIDKRVAFYMDKSMSIPAYGNVEILQELMPGHPSVLTYMQKLNDEILAESAIKIISTGFTEADINKTTSGLIVAKIAQQLMNTMPAQLQIIEGEVVTTNYMPSQIIALPNSSAYYILSGEILDASVSKTEEPSSTTQRVITSYIQEANPAYNEWLDLSKRKQKEIPQPPATVEKAVEEDIAIEKMTIEQNAVLSVAYRLANAVSASVVFSEAPTQKKARVTENIKGVVAGLFVQEAKDTPIPTDAEILDELATELAAQVAEKIASQIENLQLAYVKNADQSIVLEDFNNAVANYAYGYVLSKSKKNPDEKALQKLRTYSLRWN
jgi:predicted nucleotidyltransferase